MGILKSSDAGIVWSDHAGTKHFRGEKHLEDYLIRRATLFRRWSTLCNIVAFVFSFALIPLALWIQSFAVFMWVGGIVLLFRHFSFVVEQIRRDAQAELLWFTIVTNQESPRYCLLLRSFSIGPYYTERIPLGLYIALFSPFNTFKQPHKELEWQIVKGFEESSDMTLVALGRSNGTSGAGKILSDECNWTDQIKKMAATSEMILLIAGDTKGLRWELELIRDEGYLHKTIFIMPPQRGAVFRDREHQEYSPPKSWKEIEIFLKKVTFEDPPEYNPEGCIVAVLDNRNIVVNTLSSSTSSLVKNMLDIFPPEEMQGSNTA